MKLGTFRVDCTPPENCPVGFGTDEGTMKLKDPLYLRGFVFEDAGGRSLVASLDYCGLMNSAHDDLVRALAKAIDAQPERVVVHCIHQHDAPLLDFELEPLLNCETYPRAWWTGLVAQCTESAAQCLKNAVPIASVGHRETRIHGYASNRRILGGDGKVQGMRYSRCADPSLRDKPVGIIDPMLRTIAFREASGAIAGSMSFYATHPQVSNNGSAYSADAPGVAVRLVDEAAGGLHGFFTGAGGNVTAGKYSSPTDLDGNRERFGKILADGINANLAGMTWHEAGAIEWRTAAFPFPRKPLAREDLLAVIRDEKASKTDRMVKAVLLTCLEYEKNATYRMSLLRMGDVRVLFLPGEPFVQFQLYAQAMRADEFIALAGNCSDNFLYLPTAKGFKAGGYEPSMFCWCTPDIDAALKKAITGLLREERA